MFSGEGAFKTTFFTEVLLNLREKPGHTIIPDAWWLFSGKTTI